MGRVVAREPWNHWYHATVHTYGSWVRGDPRGWRDRGHKVHVEGDYKSPPPKGTYEKLHEYCKRLMRRERVTMNLELRQVVIVAVVERLLANNIKVIAVSVDGTHLHVLAKFLDRRHRHWIGMAKKHASHTVRQLGLRTEKGGLWAHRSRAEPIANRNHQIKAFEYICKHEAQRGVVWTFRDLPMAPGGEES